MTSIDRALRLFDKSKTTGESEESKILMIYHRDESQFESNAVLDIVFFKLI